MSFRRAFAVAGALAFAASLTVPTLGQDKAQAPSSSRESSATTSGAITSR